jgi:hypothetical protein
MFPDLLTPLDESRKFIPIHNHPTQLTSAPISKPIARHLHPGRRELLACDRWRCCFDVVMVWGW